MRASTRPSEKRPGRSCNFASSKHQTEFLEPTEGEHPICSSLIPSEHRLDYIPRSRLGFCENRGAFPLTLSENRLGFRLWAAFGDE